MASANYNARRRVEFDRALTSFAEQFTEWKARTETPTWANHYSQVRAIEAVLVGVRDRIQQEVAKIGADALPGLLPDFENAILSGWRVWEFFRAKFAQRQEEQFLDGLRAADELAWACRKPLAEAADQAHKLIPKEPALVYLSGNASPAALARDSNFWAESAPGMGDLNALCKSLMEHIPVPVISLPWHEVWHAPSLTAVAHETGHVVEVDFKLSDELDMAFEAAVITAGVPEQEEDWQRWRSEVFADFFAVRHCGPGFVGMLADVLAGISATTGAYPPPDVRMELCFVGLENLGLPDEAAARRQAWQEVSVKRGAPSPAMKAVPSVVQQLATRPFDALGGQTLGALITFDAGQLANAQQIAASLAAACHPDLPPRDTPPYACVPQLLSTAARLLYEQKPELFATDGASLDVFGLIADLGAGQRRGVMRRTPAGRSLTEDQVQKCIQAASDGVFARIKRKHGSNLQTKAPAAPKAKTAGKVKATPKTKPTGGA